MSKSWISKNKSAWPSSEILKILHSYSTFSSQSHLNLISMKSLMTQLETTERQQQLKYLSGYSLQHIVSAFKLACMSPGSQCLTSAVSVYRTCRFAQRRHRKKASVITAIPKSVQVHGTNERMSREMHPAEIRDIRDTFYSQISGRLKFNLKFLTRPNPGFKEILLSVSLSSLCSQASSSPTAEKLAHQISCCMSTNWCNNLTEWPRVVAWQKASITITGINDREQVTGRSRARCGRKRLVFSTGVQCYERSWRAEHGVAICAVAIAPAAWLSSRIVILIRLKGCRSKCNCMWGERFLCGCGLYDGWRRGKELLSKASPDVSQRT